MLTITLPEHLASVQLLAGIEFTDGVARVDVLGSHARRFFDLIGAAIIDAPESDDDAPLTAETVIVGEKPLAELTVPELRELAKIEGIDLPAKALKPEILSTFVTSFKED